MRKWIVILSTLLVVGCATTGQQQQVTKVYDRKYNTYTYVAKEPDREFVGTAATPAKPKPAWSDRGHP